MSKSADKILDYQKTIISILNKKSNNIYEMENICLCRIGHIACYESYIHALQDLIYIQGRLSSIKIYYVYLYSIYNSIIVYHVILKQSYTIYTQNSELPLLFSLLVQILR